MITIKTFTDFSDRTWAEVETFTGKRFNVRFIPAEETTGDENLLVASDDLDNYLHPGEWDDDNEGFRTDISPEEPYYKEFKNKTPDYLASRYADDWGSVFFFTDQTTFNDYNDKRLIEEMKDENPDFFPEN